MSEGERTAPTHLARAVTRLFRWIRLVIVLAAAPIGATELVVVEQPVDVETLWALQGRCVSGSRLVRLGAEGAATVLTRGFDGACDPAVSFDGHEILFSGRELATDRWQIWRMVLDTEQAVAITEYPGGAFSPLWVGSLFHLDDQAPTRRIAYLAGGSDGRPLSALHTANLDGSDELRISYAPGVDLAPDVLPNGRILYPSVALNNDPRITLMGLNIDGTDLAVFADPHDSPPFPHAVRVGPDGRVYFIESKVKIAGGGALSSVSLRRPLRSRAVLAAADDGLFLDPAPLSDGALLASFRARRSAGYELVRVDPTDGRIIETVHRSDGMHVLDAHEITPRPVVPGRSTVVDTSKTTGVFFCLSSHITDRPALAHLRDGGGSRLRVIEHHIGDDSSIRERVIGEAPIETDGSFHIEVPARTPVRFQVLDAEGATMAEQHSWTWVMPREWRGCIGCHENREMVAPNVLAEAVVKPAVRLVGSETNAGGQE